MLVDLTCSYATEFAREIEDDSIDLYILDPPFGIGEDKFQAGTVNSNIIGGYVTAPKDYHGFIKSWIGEVYRTLKPRGTVYLILGNTYNLAKAMIAAEEVGFRLLNHIIWHYNTCVVPTSKKFSSSHYHILRLGKKDKGQTFNLPTDDEVRDFHHGMGMDPVPPGRKGTPKFYDLMDVWHIKKTPSKKGEKKNLNCLPYELVQKMVKYSSDPGDVVCDLFMGNFTTAKVCIDEDRHVLGCDANPSICEHWIPQLQDKGYQ